MRNLWSSIIGFIFPRSTLELQFERAVGRGTLRAPRPHIFPWIISSADYKDPLARSAVRKLKNRRNLYIAKLCGNMMYQYLIADVADGNLFTNFKDPLLVPIPLSRSRLRSRGFNQAMLLARALTTLEPTWQLETRVLSRPINRPKQALIKNREARMRNAIGVFCVTRPDLVRDRNIILIDDVATTGATLREARRLLLAAGAQNVIAIVFAH